MPLDEFCEPMRSLIAAVEAKALIAEERLADTLRRMESEMAARTQLLNQEVDRWEAFGRSLGAASSRVRDSLADLSPRTRQALVRLGERGWYIDLEMPIASIHVLSRMIVDGEVEAAENELIEYFTLRLAGIESQLRQTHPRRARLLELAFAAHHRSEFETSVPLFLIQADGLCVDLVGSQLYKRSDGVPVLATLLGRLPQGSMLADFMHPLGHPLPISHSTRSGDPPADSLNRHVILHGAAVNYGILKNSLRAVSLLNYVAAVLALPAASEIRGPERPG